MKKSVVWDRNSGDTMVGRSCGSNYQAGNTDIGKNECGCSSQRRQSHSFFL